jgi:hypothetical protein
MKFSVRPFCCSLMIALMTFGFMVPPTLVAHPQQVTAAELRDAVNRSAAVRQGNLKQVRSFFADPKITKILKDAHFDSIRIDKAMSTLDAGELSKLAARTSQVQRDFAAGALSNQDLTYVVIAIGAAVIVLILVS